MTQSEYAHRHPSTQQVMRWFTNAHLGSRSARDVSIACGDLADEILGHLPADSPELTAGRRKLLEAKDCFVRAAIAVAEDEPDHT